MPAARRRPWPLRALLVALPLLSFGTVTWAPFAYFAARRRSPFLAVASAAYLVLTLVFFVGANESHPVNMTWWDLLMFVTLMGTTLGGAIHLAVLTGEPREPALTDEAAVFGVPLIERRVRRDQARSLVTHYPAIARVLRIGRPDLPRRFDDGGLIDVNSAPEGLLASLPGLDSYHAKLLVLARTAQGSFASVDDLVRREVLPSWAVHGLHDVLVAVPPGPEGGTDGELEGDTDVTTAKPTAAYGMPPEPPR
nr:helix-hairpin-helix domain-containing protein [Actinomadura sp. GC306]